VTDWGGSKINEITPPPSTLKAAPAEESGEKLKLDLN